MRFPLFGRAPAEYDRAFMDNMAQAYLKGTSWTRLRLAAVSDLVEPRAGDRVIDLGCAAGAVTHYLSERGCDVIGVDREPVAIEAASSLFPHLRFEQTDVRRLPFSEASFDKAVAADLIEHLDATTFEEMLREASRVLVPGGTLSLYTPNPLHLIERLKRRQIILAQNPTHIGLRPAAEIAVALRAFGFQVDRNEWRASFLPGLHRIERLAGPRFELFRYRLCLRGRKPDEP